MITGHFGLAAAVKSRATSVPLWALMLGTVWLDVVFVPLLLAGIETIGTAEGLSPGYGNAVIHADYTHSLVGAVLLSALFGWGGWALWGRRAGVVLALVSFSHWVLDLLVHRMDMPLLPANWGDLPRLGFGLWQWPWLTAAIELALIVLGAWLYWRAAGKLPDRGGSRGRLVAILILIGGAATLAADVTGILG
ncbi:MAG TPA: permease [Alphaproteobacteria bacterium]|nr:permease [Alphaproteobacteria bacterium]